MRIILLTACLFATLTLPTWAQEQSDSHATRDADAILADIDGVEMPSFDRSRGEDQDYIDQFLAERQRASERRAALILELWEAHPEHPDMIKLMPQRWSVLMSDPEQRSQAVAEMEGIVTAQPGSPLAAEALYGQSQAARYAGDAQAMERVVTTFRKSFPDDDRAARMLSMLADMLGDEPERAVAIYRDLLKSYPDNHGNKYIEGKIKQLTSLGQPFALSFDDAVGGEHIDLADLRGKVVVVDFWATWCGPCVGEMPHMKELYAQFHPQGVEFVGVSLDSPPTDGGLDKLKAFVAKNEIPWPQYYQGKGWDGDFSVSWGINAIPALFVVDKAGRLSSIEARGQLETLLPDLLGKAE